MLCIGELMKQAMSKQGSTSRSYRYFTRQELREVFTLLNPHTSTTYQQLIELHPENERKSYEELKLHLEWMKGIKGTTKSQLQ